MVRPGEVWVWNVISIDGPRGGARESARRVNVANKAATLILVPQDEQSRAGGGIELEGFALTRGGGDKPAIDTIGNSRKPEKRG